MVIRDTNRRLEDDEGLEIILYTDQITISYLIKDIDYKEEFDPGSG